MIFQLLLWDWIYQLVRAWYIYGPAVLGGHEGLSLLDICSRNLGISSTVLLSEAGREICAEQLENKLTGITTMCVTFLLAVVVTYIPSMLVYIKNLLLDQGRTGSKKALEKNVGVKSLAKILYICKDRRKNVERAVWGVVENGNKHLKDRVLDEYRMMCDQQYIEL